MGPAARSDRDRATLSALEHGLELGVSERAFLLQMASDQVVFPVNWLEVGGKVGATVSVLITRFALATQRQHKHDIDFADMPIERYIPS